MSDPEKPTVLSFDLDGLCDPETGVCAWPPAASAFQETESSKSERSDDT